MALDGIMINALCREFSQTLTGGKVEKITQPEKDDAVLHFHVPNSARKNVRLLLCANPSSARACLTDAQLENPSVAPNFCMLLRKHLGGARLVSVEQPDFERVLIFNFDCRTELRESVSKKLVLEIMGKWSNLVLTDGGGKIYDALRQVDFSVSEKRQLFPGLQYELPPSQNKITLAPDSFAVFGGEERLDKWLTNTYTGFSPLLSRELAFELTGATDSTACDSKKLNDRLTDLYNNVKTGNFRFCMLSDEKPLEFYCFDILQYGSAVSKTFFDTPSQAVEAFYSSRRMREHIKRGSSDITKLLSTLIARTGRKIAARTAELEECKNAGEFKRIGDIITASLYMLKKGDSRILLPDYYQNGAQTEVALDRRLTPSENAQHYYRMYKKAVTAQKILAEQLPAAQRELEYLESVASFAERANSLSEIAQLREELYSGGYLKKARNAPKINRDNTPVEYCSTDGFTIFAGKNNLQNDNLTLKIAEKKDIWFHVKNYPGSHVVVVCGGRPVPDTTLTQAAIIAATNSKISDGSNVEVDYTEVKNIKKPSGAKPGMVIYEVYKTAVVTPSEELINELIVKK